GTAARSRARERARRRGGAGASDRLFGRAHPGDAAARAARSRPVERHRDAVPGWWRGRCTGRGDALMRVAVLGTGVMGPGVAQVAAQAGHQVCLWNRRPASVERGRAAVEQSLGRLVKKEKLSAAEAASVLARIAPTSVLEDVKDAELVIEAVAE